MRPLGRRMLILGIETSCDETAAAVVKDGKEILSNIISSQVDIHSRYGGVVPELACRNHIENLPLVIKQALDEAKTNMPALDSLAVTVGQMVSINRDMLWPSPRGG